MSNEQPHSGSRWEPTPAGAAVDDRVDRAGEQTDPAHHDEPVADRPAAAEQAGPAAAPDGAAPGLSDVTDEAVTARMGVPPAPVGPWPPLFSSAAVGAAPKPRRSRAGLIAAAAAGLLAVAGAGGYAVGRGAAPDAPPAGFAGATGEYGHHRGPLGDDGDGRVAGRSGDGRLGDGGPSTGTGTTGNGTGNTGSTGTST